MRLRLAAAGVIAALAAVGAPTALASPTIRLTGTSVPTCNLPTSPGSPVWTS